MTMWINQWKHWHAFSLSMCYTEKYTQTFTQHEEVVWTWAWKEIIYCYTNRKHVGWNKRANIHAIFLLCTYSYFYDYYFSFMVFKWDYSIIHFKYRCFQPLGKGLLKAWYWLRNRRLMLTSWILDVCQILPHAVKFYFSDQTGEIHSCPYAMTDVKAIGLWV